MWAHGGGAGIGRTLRAGCAGRVSATETPGSVRAERRALLPFSEVRPLLASPPSRGQLHSGWRALADQAWRHPGSGEWVYFGVLIIERGHDLALQAKQDPVGPLRLQVCGDAGRITARANTVAENISAHDRDHPPWSGHLHADNLAVGVEKAPAVAPCPGDGDGQRCMKAHNLSHAAGGARCTVPKPGHPHGVGRPRTCAVIRAGT